MTVGNPNLVRGEVATSLDAGRLLPRLALLRSEKVGLGLWLGDKRNIEVGGFNRRHFDVFQHIVQRYSPLPDVPVIHSGGD